MGHLCRAELVQCASEKISEVACEHLKEFRLGKNPKSLELVRNLGKLAGVLAFVSIDHQKKADGEHEDQRDRIVRWEHLLGLLEMICTFPKNNLSESSQRNELSARFPTLNTLITGPNTPPKVVQSVKRFASSSSLNKPYFDFLTSLQGIQHQTKKGAASALQATKKPLEGGDAEKKTSVEDPSYPKHVYDTLYKVIRKYGDCCCGPPNQSMEPRKRHWGRLELGDTMSTADNDVLFHTVFSKEGSVRFEKIKWQHLQFRVPRKQYKKRQLHFDNNTDGNDIAVSKHDNDTQPLPISDCTTMLTSASEFCELLRNDIGSVSMVVRIVNEMIFDLDRAEDIEVDVADERSIPLVEVLERNCLGPQSKLLLAYTLAKSVWQFYDSDFMRIYWTTESIHLFEEKEREEEDDDESENDEGGRERSVDWAPYYAFPFEDMREVETVERLPLGKFIHRYPHVLALGLLLYELGLKRRSKKRIKPGEPATTPEKRINDNAKRIRTGVTSDKWPNIGLKHPESLEKYRIIVANCASESVFRPPTTEDATKTPLQMEEELHIEERRAMLYRKVVVPLKELLRDAGWINESGNIARQLVKGDNAMSKKCHISKDSVSETLLANTSQSFEVAPNGIQQASTVSMKAEAWLENIKRSSLAKELHSQFQNNGVLASKRIRIAVLDTGYDPDAIFFNRERKKRLKGWRDFTVKAQPVGKDEDGHGTHVLSVLMQVAATADIYVARVARDTSELQYSTQNVANAIEWAWKCCGANIISMSFGFDDEIYVDDKPVISNAIYKALQKTNQQILFFAAAANDGGNRPEMFPANSPQVFSIRGSDDTGWQQPFNPPPDYDASTCFMTLGKDVPGASLSASKHKGANVCKSGTSVATPIAAGIAAILLGYARIHEKELCQSLQFQHDIMLLSLWKMSGMREMFKNIATTMVDKWAYLSLSKFIKQSQGVRLSNIIVAVTNTPSSKTQQLA